jgi:hypothetical protein
MRTWHPDSWSKQARNKANKVIAQVAKNEITMEDAEAFFAMSYRHSKIRYRAAKRFGRWKRTATTAYTKAIVNEQQRIADEVTKAIQKRFANK